jgi:cytochrome c556
MKRLFVAFGLLLLTAPVLTAPAQAQDYIAIRKAGQGLMAGTFGGLRAAVTDKTDVKKLVYPPSDMAAWMRVFPSLFPKGTETGEDTKALPAVWSDRAGFEKAAANFVAAAQKLSDLAKAGDTEAFATQVKVVGEACGACHKDYRAK